MLALAAGVHGDDTDWRSRALTFAGATARSPRLMAVTAFVEARLAVHRGDTADAERLVWHAFDEFAQPWYRAYANAAGAELAVAAGLPDARDRLEQAEHTAAECDWAAACVARTRSRLTGDPAAFAEASAICNASGPVRTGVHLGRPGRHRRFGGQHRRRQGQAGWLLRAVCSSWTASRQWVARSAGSGAPSGARTDRRVWSP
jgi:hypothetical protein